MSSFYCQKKKMKCLFKKNLFKDRERSGGFTLAEAVAAVVILGIICSSVLVVINRTMLAVADETLKMQAFQIARENMEKLLASSSVKETSDYGTSEQYPQITWQTTVESFYEPLTTRLWIQAICSAEYFDSTGEQRKVELTNWITDLSQQQIIEMLKNKEQNTKLLIEADQILQTIREAAAFVGLDLGTIQEWINIGMPITEEGYFIKAYLDLYKRTSGNPTIEDKIQVEEFLKELTQPIEEAAEDETSDEGVDKADADKEQAGEGKNRTSEGDLKGTPKSKNPTKTDTGADSGTPQFDPDKMSLDELR
jgi:type II secretory pathway pseudopilin PulG